MTSIPTRLGNWISCPSGSSTSNTSPDSFSKICNKTWFLFLSREISTCIDIMRYMGGKKKLYIYSLYLIWGSILWQNPVLCVCGLYMMVFETHITFTSLPLSRGFCISRFSSPQQPAVFELHTRTAPSQSSWKRGLKCSARSSELHPRSIWNLCGSQIKVLLIIRSHGILEHHTNVIKTLNHQGMSNIKFMFCFNHWK